MPMFSVLVLSWASQYSRPSWSVGATSAVSKSIRSSVTLVNEPATGVLAPITVLSISPAATSTLLITTEPVPSGVRFRLPFRFVVEIVLTSILTLSTSSSVNAPVLGVEAPTVVPSIAPLLMSTLVRVLPSNVSGMSSLTK